jgi:hypothetical protein
MMIDHVKQLRFALESIEREFSEEHGCSNFNCVFRCVKGVAHRGGQHTNGGHCRCLQSMFDDRKFCEQQRSLFKLVDIVSELLKDDDRITERMRNDELFSLRLIVGDWSEDGHGRSDHFFVRSNKDMYLVRDAYEIGAMSCGVDITKFVAGYEECRIPDDAVEKLRVAGLEVDEWISLCENGTDYHGQRYIESTEAYIGVWLFIARFGDPSLRITVEEPGSFCIGGYGLFHL